MKGIEYDLILSSKSVESFISYERFVSLSQKEKQQLRFAVISI